MDFSTRFLVAAVSVASAAVVVFHFDLFRKSVAADKALPDVPIVEASAQISVPDAAPVFPKVLSISPEDGTQDVALDIEDPIIVRFDRSTEDSFVDFRLNPPVSVTYQNNPEKTEFRILPKEPLLVATSYDLDIFIKPRGAEDVDYKPLASSRFVTVKERLTEQQQVVANKLSEAKRDTKAQIMEGKYIDVSISSQVMVLFEDGRPLDAYLVSSGKRGMDTPKGQYKIENKVKRAWSKTYGLYMPYWMAITPSGKFGIHELPEWPSGYKEGASHLGIPVSHGCVRLGVGSAQRTWEWASVGTPVIVH